MHYTVGPFLSPADLHVACHGNPIPFLIRDGEYMTRRKDQSYLRRRGTSKTLGSSLARKPGDVAFPRLQ